MRKIETGANKGLTTASELWTLWRRRSGGWWWRGAAALLWVSYKFPRAPRLALGSAAARDNAPVSPRAVVCLMQIYGGDPDSFSRDFCSYVVLSCVATVLDTLGCMCVYLFIAYILSYLIPLDNH